MSVHTPSLEYRIHTAIEQALYPEEAPIQGLPTSALNEALASIGDLDPIPGVLGKPTDGDGLVTMLNSVELALGLQYASSILGMGRSAQTVLDTLDHERQHAEAAGHLGVESLHAIRFKSLNQRLGMKATTIPFTDTPLTKIQYASILARPQRLSRSDTNALNGIGYAGPYDVAQKIKATGTDALPPLSIQ